MHSNKAATELVGKNQKPFGLKDFFTVKESQALILIVFSGSGSNLYSYFFVSNWQDQLEIC